MLTEADIEQMKKPNLWAEHHKAMRNPQYLIDGLMDCFREEMGYFQPYHYPMDEKGIIKPPELRVEPQWAKRQWDYVKQLEARVLHYQKLVQRLIAKRKDDSL